MVTMRNQSGNPSRPPAVYGSGRRHFAATPIIDVPNSSDSLPHAALDPPPPTVRRGGRAPQPRTPPSPSLSHHLSDFMMPAQVDALCSFGTLIHARPLGTSQENFASGFPNPLPQPSPEPTHSFRSRHSQPSSFAASYDEVPSEEDHDDVDYHGRRRRGRAFAVPADELFVQSLADFNFSMGFVTDVTDQFFLTALREIPANFDADSVYATLTNLPNAAYNAKNTKGWHIYDPALRYIHRFLAYNYSGRNDTSAALSKVELFFLWCMHSCTKVNLGFWFARAFERVVRTDRPLILGPYITRLTSRLFPLTFNSNEFTFAFTMDPLDARCLDSMGLLTGTPRVPHIVPLGTITQRDGRVFLRRVN
ncbi:hypothetical protein V6N11_042754 [Hibiscus sabdariffa]|uniref:Aminotransferase-like plant mobile domain-containing protein n=1 Tax=Hibiscus sabdariffa TaxID=183260 RepID=A0ABR2QXE5_9ROSI